MHRLGLGGIFQVSIVLLNTGALILFKKALSFLTDSLFPDISNFVLRADYPYSSSTISRSCFKMYAATDSV